MENVPDEPIGEQEESENVNSPEESAAVEEGLEWEDAPLEFYEAQEDGLYQFLCRLYEKILQRPGDQEGIAYWYDLLRSGKMSGAEIVMKFGNSTEMEAQKLDNPQFIGRLYIGPVLTGSRTRKEPRTGQGCWIRGFPEIMR
ncbi:MAG: DUF4214 domain-containing protein [Eubacterium ramulus]